MRRLVGLALASALTLSACSAPSLGVHQVVVSGPASPTVDAVTAAYAAESADAVSADAIQFAANLKYVRIRGHFDVAGSLMTVDISTGVYDDCVGSFRTPNGGEGDLIVTAKGVYVRGDEAFWRAASPHDAQAFIATAGTGWYAFRSADDAGGLTYLCDAEYAVWPAANDAFAPGVSLSPSAIGAKQAVKIAFNHPERTAIATYISPTGDHAILGSDYEHGGHLTFSEFDRPVRATAPRSTGPGSGSVPT